MIPQRVAWSDCCIENKRIFLFHYDQLRQFSQKSLDSRERSPTLRVILNGSKADFFFANAVRGIIWLDDPFTKSLKWLAVPIKLLTPFTDVGSGKSLIPCILESDSFTPLMSETWPGIDWCHSKKHLLGFNQTLNLFIWDMIWKVGKLIQRINFEF